MKWKMEDGATREREDRPNEQRQRPNGQDGRRGLAGGLRDD